MNRCAPASAACLARFKVARWFVVLSCCAVVALSGTCAARWMTVSTLFSAAVQSVLGRKSPMGVCWMVVGRVSLRWRTAAIRGWLCWCKCWVRAEPTKPVAPVSNIVFMGWFWRVCVLIQTA